MALKSQHADRLISYFSAALERQQRLDQILELARQGIPVCAMMPSVIDRLDHTKDPAREAPLRQSWDGRAQLAQSEMDNDFATLNGFGVLALWGLLECFVIDWATLWLECRTPKQLAEIDVRLRLSVAQLMSMSRAERAAAIVEQIDKDVGGPLRLGAGRFSTLLEKVGVSVTLDADQRRTWLEFQQVRNCLAHRAGIVDQRLHSTCPWLGLKIGDTLSVTSAMRQQYMKVAGALIGEGVLIVSDHAGLNLRAEVQERESAEASKSVESDDGLGKRPR